MPNTPHQPDPWPHGYEPEHGTVQRFHPDRPRFADIPVLRRTQDGFEVVHGSVEQSWIDEANETLLALPVATHVGVFEEELVPEGQPAHDPRYLARLTGPGLPRGIDNLDELIAELRTYSSAVLELARELEHRRDDGFVLDGYDELQVVYLIDTRYAQRDR